MEALTSSKRGLEKDRDIEPEKSSIGLISSRISSSPEAATGSPATRACHASFPINQSKESVCRASRLGTSSCSEIFPKEIRSGPCGLPALFREVVLPGRETAKVRPSEDRRRRCARTPIDPRQGGHESRKAAQTSSVAARHTAVHSGVERVGSPDLTPPFGGRP